MRTTLLALILLSMSAAAADAQYRVCKRVTGQGRHVQKGDAIGIARANFARLRGVNMRAGYVPSGPAYGPSCVVRRDGWRCSVSQRLCRQR